MKKYLRIIVLFLILILIANITLLALTKISEVLFWIVIVIVAVFAYKILPKLRN